LSPVSNGTRHGCQISATRQGVCIKNHESLLKGETQAEDQEGLHLQSEEMIVLDGTILKMLRTSAQWVFKLCTFRNTAKKPHEQYFLASRGETVCFLKESPSLFLSMLQNKGSAIEQLNFERDPLDRPQSKIVPLL
jgi:hypothetical protein